MLKCTHICANFSLNTLLLQVQRAKSISICVNFPTISKNDSPTGYCENPNGWIQRLIKQVSIQKYEMYLKPFRRIYRRDCGMRRDWKSVGRCEQKAQNNGLKRLAKVPFLLLGKCFIRVGFLIILFSNFWKFFLQTKWSQAAQNAKWISFDSRHYSTGRSVLKLKIFSSTCSQKLTEAQLSLCRDIRRRGKNKVFQHLHSPVTFSSTKILCRVWPLLWYMLYWGNAAYKP